MKAREIFLTLTLALSTLSVVAQASPWSAAGSFPAHTALENYLNDEAYLTYIGAKDAVDRAFIDICPDVWCEGEYENIATTGFVCSVATATDVVNSCVWSFGGVNHFVDANTGKIKTQSARSNCVIVKNVKLDDLMAFFAMAAQKGQDPSGRNIYKSAPFYLTVPGTNSELMDIVTDCLDAL